MPNPRKLSVNSVKMSRGTSSAATVIIVALDNQTQQGIVGNVFPNFFQSCLRLE